MILRRVGDIQIVNAMYHIPAGTHPDFIALDVLTQVLVAQPSGRLHKALVETGQATSAFGAERQMREPGSVFFGAIVHKERSLETARNTLLGVLEGIAAQPITEQEVERARTKLKNDVEQLLASSRSLAIALSEMIALGDWRLLFVYRDQLEKVQRADVQRVATEYLRPANRTLGLFQPAAQPEKVAIPRAPELNTLLANLSGANDVAAGEAFEPTPANIEARIIRQGLPSGMKLALLPKKTRGGRVYRAARAAVGRRGEQGQPERRLLARERHARTRYAQTDTS